jgi:hemoglobin
MSVTGKIVDTKRQSVHEMIGGEAALARLVETFYDIIETDPVGAEIHALHLRGFGLSHVRQAQFEFLSGFLGGPQYYLERMGHANLRTLHAHLEIGPEHVEAWLTCMRKAIATLGCDADVETTLMSHFTRSAQALRNRA